MAINFSFDLRQLEQVSSDPLALMTGFAHGYANRPPPAPPHPENNDIPTEYRRGWMVGKAVRMGAAPMPPWAASNQEVGSA